MTAIDEQRRLESEVVVAEQQVAERQGEVDALRCRAGAGGRADVHGRRHDGLGPMLDDSQAYTEQLQRDQLARVALSSGDATTDQLDVSRRGPQGAARGPRGQAGSGRGRGGRRRGGQAGRTTPRRPSTRTPAPSAESELGRLIQEEEERAGPRVLRADACARPRRPRPGGGRAGGPAGGGRCGRRGRGAAAGRRRGVSRCAGGRCASDPSGTANARRPDDEAPAPEAVDGQSSGGGGDGGGGG